MDDWLNIVIRQLILYSLPVLISLSIVTLIEAKWTRSNIPYPFFSLNWHGAWLPLLASIAFHRGIIIALPQPLKAGAYAALIRLLAHLILCLLGFILYVWSLQHAAPTGLPPLHHWWAKVLMFFNLCLACIHLLPLPGLWLGEWMLTIFPHIAHTKIWQYAHHTWLLPCIAATSLLDWLLGGWVTFPIYQQLAQLATKV